MYAGPLQKRHYKTPQGNANRLAKPHRPIALADISRPHYYHLFLNGGHFFKSFFKTPNKRKIFMIISHVNGKSPDGKTAIDIKQDANVKIHVEGFLGSVISRFGSKKNYLIWEHGAKQHWGKDFLKKLNKGYKEPKKEKKAGVPEALPEAAAPVEVTQEEFPFKEPEN